MFAALMQDLEKEMGVRKAERDDWSSDERVQERIADLKERAALLQQKEDLQVGDIIIWKPGLQNRKLPAYGEPVIVLALYPGEVDTEETTDSPYYQTPLDIECGRIQPKEDGHFLQYRLNSARMMKIG